MSAKLTIVFFILICFEIGILLIILPWIPYPSWNENYLLVLAADKLQLPGLPELIGSGYFRGAVTGLGILNIVLGIVEIFNFKSTVGSFQRKWNGDQGLPQPQAADLPDNRQEEAPLRRN